MPLKSPPVNADPVRSSTKIKAYTYDPFLNGNVGGTALTSGRMYAAKLPLWDLTVLTGMCIAISTQGNYTATTTNRVGLYRSDGTTLTLVASTADDGNLWKGSGGTNADKAFSTPYTPSSVTEHLYGAYLWRSSATTTAPAVPGLSTAGALVDIGSTSQPQHRAGYISSQTDLPATVLHSSFGFAGGNGQNLFWMGCY